MRVIAVGCEYSGVTSLLNGLRDWGSERGFHFHLDDHFSIPDRYHLSPEDQKIMSDLPPVLKERFQRMQLVYHIRVANRHEHCLLGGFHIEEGIYGPLYYYPGTASEDKRQYEVEMPADAILVHLTARTEVIRSRMRSDQHDFNLIREADIDDLLERFKAEYTASWLSHKIEIDTSELTPPQLLDTYFERVKPHLNTRDMLSAIESPFERSGLS